MCQYLLHIFINVERNVYREKLPLQEKKKKDPYTYTYLPL